MVRGERLPKTLMIDTLLHAISVRRELLEMTGDRRYIDTIDHDLTLLDALIKDDIKEYAPNV